jgi:hypothetical protein
MSLSLSKASCPRGAAAIDARRSGLPDQGEAPPIRSDQSVATTNGDVAAALKRLDEIGALIASLLSNPGPGRRLSGPLDAWLARHCGCDQMITKVFRPYAERDILFLVFVAFGGRDCSCSALHGTAVDQGSRYRTVAGEPAERGSRPFALRAGAGSSLSCAQAGRQH